MRVQRSPVRSIIYSGGFFGILTAVFAVMLTVSLAPAADAQVFQVIHNFTGGGDGSSPGSVTFDRQGNIYGNELKGGVGGASGAIFRMKHSGASWLFTPLASFSPGSSAGGYPSAVTIGPNGSLYITNRFGGDTGGQCDPYGCGTIVNLMPPVSACKTAICPWNIIVLYTFGAGGASDGTTPNCCVAFDRAGNFFGTTAGGGTEGYGTVYKMAPSNGGWTETILHNFLSGSNGGIPTSGVVIDQVGNMYGTTDDGGSGGCGTLYELTPSGSGWTETTLYNFQGLDDGCDPLGQLIIDAAGNLYGTTDYNGSGNGGTVFELSPSGGSWAFQTLYGIHGTRSRRPRGGCNHGCGGKPLRDNAYRRRFRIGLRL